ncbi:MAG: glycosyltransferase family 39 protein [Deltaproteobacteria bacterium]|nr:glycosyltransferase family 39 protein [Deltaproteobacteria bacterium]
MSEKLKEEFRFLDRWAVPLLISFIALRFLWLLNFPIFNDEALYINYSQLMHADWDGAKFISVANPNHDWKPPLLYWFGAPFIGSAGDPLLTARLVSASVSIIGFLSVYYFAGYFFNDKRTAFWTGLLWILNPLVLFYDRVFIAETFVYSFSAAALLFTYLTISKSRSFIFLAVPFGAFALLSKQSGQLTIISLLFLALPGIKKADAGQRRWNMDFKSALLAAAVALLSYLLYRVIIPAEYFSDYGMFIGRWTFSLADLMKFPVGSWLNNLKMAYTQYSHYYTLISLAAVLLFIYCAYRGGRRHRILLALFLFNTSAVVFGLRSFNEYIYNTSNAVYLTLILGASAGHIMGFAEKKDAPLIKYIFKSSVAILPVLWISTLPWYYGPAESYIEKYGTPWMEENFLLGWPSGFGIKEAVDLLQKESGKTVYLDPQPGNPRTAILVYRKRYPSLEFMPIDRSVIDGLHDIDAKKAIFLFRDRPGLEWSDKVLRHDVCKKKIIFKTVDRQIPLVFCKGE